MDDRPLHALGALAALVAVAAPEELSYAKLKAKLRDAVAEDPIDATVTMVSVASWLFYHAEKGHNPKVVRYSDALVFISTCLSVGYADVFARTDLGKLIATTVMTLGPAVSGALLEPPARERRAAESAALDGQRQIADRLDAILRELKARPI